MNLLGGLNKHIARHKNRDFLDAALAVSVLATQADGPISFSERYRIDRKMAELIVRIALSVSHSGGGYDAAKRARVVEICAALGYTPGCILGERRLGV
jgi:tellurite resistance protein